MATTERADSADKGLSSASAARFSSIYPRGFGLLQPPLAQDVYLSETAILKLAQFFTTKGLAAIKDEDRREQWYDDWLTYQAEHKIYASVLSPAQYSTRGSQFDPLRYARFLEVFGYFSPAHGYSAQVSFLGLFAILMGENDALKREAVIALERGGLLAFGVSERTHGSDLLAGDFTIKAAGPGQFLANGTKYYIGNSNVASIISILARREDEPTDGRNRRMPFALFALRPSSSSGYRNVRKIHTLGVRAGYVGEFAVTDHAFPDTDIIAEGRAAWDAVLGTVTLGKFFLGFGSIGICEHAFHEAVDHLKARILYDKPAMHMPHIRAMMTQVYARLTAMKLYAYRALDYVQSAHADDRRYVLFCAVQKAKVSTEGVKTMALLQECIGAKGFEADTYFEMALRDAQLIPSLESSAHINLGLTVQFCSRYFDGSESNLVEPKSLVAGDAAATENPYLMTARTGAVNSISFPPFLNAYAPFRLIPNVRLFVGQVKRFRLFLGASPAKGDAADLQYSLAAGQCLATIAYAQLIAENAHRLDVPREIVATIFHLLVSDLSAAASTLAALPQVNSTGRRLARRMIRIPRTARATWDFVSARMDAR